MQKITANDGMQTARVDTAAPLKPAVLYPMYVALLTATGPGVDSAIATISRNSFFVIHFFFSTNSFIA